MAARSVWKGFIRFSLVAVPVKAYSAKNSDGGRVGLNQLHKGCNGRIQYKKTCPVHGEVKPDEIVSGYEFDAGKYVVVDPAEIDKLRPASERAINVSAFIRGDQVDPAYFNGYTYYLLPDGPVAAKPYALMRKVLVDSGRVAFAQVVMHGKEQVLLVRPADNVLAMTMLSYDAEVRKPSEFDAEAPKVEVSPDELKLARTLVDTLAADAFSLGEYRDKYNDRLRELIELKIKGEEVVAPPEQDDAPPVINLMEALQRSLDQAKRSAKPPKQVAPGTAAKAATATRARKKA